MLDVSSSLDFLNSEGQGQAAQHWNLQDNLHCGEAEAKPLDLVSWKKRCALYFYNLHPYIILRFYDITFLHFGNTESSGFSDSGFKISLFENILHSLL